MKLKFILTLIGFLFSFFALAQPCNTSISSVPNPAVICNGESLVLTASSGGNAYTWAPSTTLSASTGATVTATPTVNITYTVTATGCTGAATATIVVTVHPTPTAGFTHNPASPCGNVPINFTNTSVGAGLTYQWTFGDGGTSNATSPSHTFSSATGSATQNFTVTLIATNAFGCADTITQTVTVSQIPSATLGGTGATVYNGLNYFKVCTSSSTNFTFTNTSTTSATNTNYVINWGDASPNFTAASWASTTHTYSVGQYTITYTVTGPNGCTSVATYYVFVGSNPSVGIGNPGNTDICAPNTLTFPITGAAGNTPGTTYTVTFNDGSAPVNFVQPPPSSVSHTFTVTSCGVTSSNGTTSFPNSFSASITASNPCGTSAGAIVPIYVSTVPTASLTVSPNPICVGSSSCMTNTSTGAGDIANGVCVTASPCIWYITPATGWTLTSGTLGNSFGQNGDPSLWLAGSTTICANFTTVGTYTIKIITGGHCGVDSTTSTLCVVPPPVPSFTINPTTGCAPLLVATTNTSTHALCDPLSYWWTVTPATGWSFATGTNISLAPSFSFTQAGSYTISVSVTSVCGVYPFSQVIVVQSPPVVSVNPLSGACGSVTVNPTGNFNAGGGTITSYGWTFPGGNPATSNQQIPPAVTYNTPGTYTITATATNSCGPSSGSTTVTVYPIPIANAGANQTICAGTTTTLNGSASNGTPNYNYSWSPTATLGSPFSSSTTATPAANTTYTLLVTDANGCTDNDQMTVTLIPAPTVVVNAVPSSICQGQSSVLTANGATTYTWSPNTALSATTGSSVTATPNITTTYTVTGTTGTCSDIETVIVTVNPIPVLNIIPNPVTICIGGSTPLSVSGASTYTWSPSSGLSVSTGSNVTASPTVTTTYTVLGTSVSNCTATTTVVVTVTTLPTVLATATSYTICNGQTTTLNGSGATSYSWNPATGLSAPNSQTTSASPTTTITYTLTGTSGANCQATDTVVVNVLPLPNIQATPNPPQICAGGSAVLTATGGGGYQWSPSTGLSQTNGNNITATPTVTTTYTVTGNGANGCSNTNTVVLIVNPLPVVSVNPPAPFICLGNSQVLTASGAGSYTWTPSANLSASTGTTVTATPVSVGTFTYTVVGTTTAGCTASTTVALGVNGLPNVVASTLNYTICFGSSTILNVAGAVNYTWSPNTGLSSSTGNSVTANPTATTTYTVTGTSGLNCNDDDTVVVNVLPLPVINSNPANPSICIGESISITLNGAVNYSWSPNTGLNITTGPTVTANPTTTTTYTVTVTGANGCTTQSQVIVVVHPLPNLNVNPNPVVLCLNSSQNLTATGASTYVWSPNVGLSSTTGNVVSINPTVNITYSVIATSIFGCQDSTTVSVTVNTNTVAVSPDYQLCLGESTTMTASNGSSYQWSPNTGLNNSTGSTVTASPTVTTTYTATALTTGGCSTTDTVLIIVNPIPNVGLVPASVIQCAGTSILMNSSGANSYSWSPSSSLSASTGSSVTASPFTNTTYTVIGTDLNGCKDSAFSQIIVYPLPPINAGIDISVCHTPITVTLTGFTPQGGTWAGPGITDPINAVFNPMVSGLGTFTLFYSVINANGCTNLDSIHVSVTPTTWPVAGPGDTVCFFSPLFVLTGNSPAGGYWSGFGIVNNLSGTFNPTLAGPGLHPVFYSIGSGQCTTSDTTFVLVQPAPNLNTLPVFPQLCIGSSVQITASGALTYTWSPSTNISSTTGATVTVNPTTTTIYTLSGTSALGCTNSIPLTVVVNPLPTVEAGPNQTVCLYAVPFNMSGFNPVGGFWTGTGVTNGFQGTFNPAVAGVGTFLIHYTVTNTNGCSKADSLYVTVIQPVIADAGNNDSTCVNAGAFNLTGFTPAGGVWSGLGITNPSAGTFDPLLAGVGNHILVYSPSSTQCFYQDSIVMSVLPTPTLNLLAGSNNICAGQSTNIVASGGTSYTWSPAATLSVSTGSSVVANPVVTTTYTVTATDASSCSIISTIVITINPLPSVNINPNNPSICLGQSANLIANGANTYTWSPAASLSSSTGSTVQASPPITTMYTVVGVSAAGCANTDSVTVVVFNLPQVQLTPVNTWICLGTSTILNASGASTYTWTPASSLSSPIGSSVTASPSVSTTYTVVGVDLNGCASSATASVTVYPGPVTFNQPNPAICRGDSTTIVASGAVSYAWSPLIGLSTGTGNTVVVNPTSTTTYSIIGTDINGCTATWPLTVTVHFPVMNIAPDSVSICDGQSSNIISNGAVSYQWSPASSLSSSVTATVTASPTVSTTYTLIGYDQFNCTDTLNSIITVFPQPIAGFIFDPAEGCDPVTVAFGDTSPYALNWVWNFSDGTSDSTQNPVHTFVGQGTYDVTLYVTGLGGCNDQTTQNNIITVFPEPVADFLYSQSTTPYLNGDVYFTNLSINSDSWLWNFDDGDTSHYRDPLHTYEFSGAYNVMLVAMNMDGCIDTIYKPIELDFFKGLYVPNAMTPLYGPAADRVFTPKGFGLKTYHIQVFNTWGNLMWESYKLDRTATVESWDGYYKGVLMPQDAYVWRCEATFMDDSIWLGMKYPNGRYQTSGTVTLLR